MLRFAAASARSGEPYTAVQAAHISFTSLTFHPPSAFDLGSLGSGASCLAISAGGPAIISTPMRAVGSLG